MKYTEDERELKHRKGCDTSLINEEMTKGCIRPQIIIPSFLGENNL